ncbi:hypothetical protein A3770_03p26300 [Chloropicon primus]|uniref:Uncharacterized protein n=1 Tax=Chloropicon primus TaxID=1764295 RepID=A0A5B8ML59_9CHLO|nr:hypothetical protein A3770_03p26300 [Chloropicon primus]|mmetsp:Transcript_6808/g.19907  ORF Transcript_6808/g.19907 Transcript_6808/m.19907 type:complete len:355 (-) Transcript_6808:128-1192(-)|eukprot:QDZ20112.1 hypothetical protein A3770_03p26300 [Chloropicon primus]
MGSGLSCMPCVPSRRADAASKVDQWESSSPRTKVTKDGAEISGGGVEVSTRGWDGVAVSVKGADMAPIDGSVPKADGTRGPGGDLSLEGILQNRQTMMLAIVSSVIFGVVVGLGAMSGSLKSVVSLLALAAFFVAHFLCSALSQMTTRERTELAARLQGTEAGVTGRERGGPSAPRRRVKSGAAGATRSPVSRAPAAEPPGSAAVSARRGEAAAALSGSWEVSEAVGIDDLMRDLGISRFIRPFAVRQYTRDAMIIERQGKEAVAFTDFRNRRRGGTDVFEENVPVHSTDPFGTKVEDVSSWEGPHLVITTTGYKSVLRTRFWLESDDDVLMSVTTTSNEVVMTRKWKRIDESY